MKRALLFIAVALFPLDLFAAGFTDLGDDISIRPEGGVELGVDFRARGAALHNFDLDRGLDPEGAPLYPIPNDRAAQTLTGADLRLRTDLAAYAPFGDVAVKMRIDWLDLAAGSTPDGPSQAVVTQRPLRAINLRRAYLETLTPIGLLSIGRSGAHWGTGMLANGGDCIDCDSGDAADRLAFITPLVGHIFAVAYDLGFVGETVAPADRVIDLDPSDDVRSITFAAIRYRTDASIARRRTADVSTLDYGLSLSHRWQKNDAPGAYIDGFDEGIVVPRGLKAWLIGGYLAFYSPLLDVRAEGAFLTGEIAEPSLIPGVRYDTPITFDQWGGVLETEFGRTTWPVRFGVDAGIASGDGATGFGARPGVLEPVAEPGELDGPQANPPFDNAINNFRFHRDYHVDQILFREIVGTVTDAVYVRPHVTWKLARAGQNAIDFDLAGIASFALNASSTPGGATDLGFEIDPTLNYTNGPFVASLHYALFLPGAAFDNTNLNARPAQLLRAVISARF